MLGEFQSLPRRAQGVHELDAVVGRLDDLLGVLGRTPNIIIYLRGGEVAGIGAPANGPKSQLGLRLPVRGGTTQAMEALRRLWRG